MTLALSDTILGRRAARTAFGKGKPFLVSCYSYGDGVRYVGPVNGHRKPKPSVRYRVRVRRRTQPTADAAYLKAIGYRRISNKHGLVARIDRPDWVAHMASEMRRAPADFTPAHASFPSANWCDHYRRCYARDILRVSAHVAHRIPTSSGDPTGFVDVGELPDLTGQPDKL